ncbi:MAG TPA: hypothetical protein VHE83_06940 [Mycobacteriales bacterium]|nr:hypothetical protein [Mycobacteriales bacterium]
MARQPRVEYPNDWLIFEHSARVIAIGGPHYPGGALHIWANEPAAQFGPPPVLAVAGLQGWLTPTQARWVAMVVMALAGLAIVAMAERLALRAVSAGETVRVRAVTLVGGAAATAAWSTGVGLYRHIDDVIALTCAVGAVLLIDAARRGTGRNAFWLAAVLLGTGAAAKPWAVVFVPVLFALPRPRIAPALLVATGTAFAFWVPFLIGDPHTASSIASYPVPVQRDSGLHALGVRASQYHPYVAHSAPGAIRLLQFGLGGLACLVVARRRWWIAAPLSGLALRLAIEPQTWPYYGMGPVVLSLLVDLSRGSRTRLELTALALVAWYALPNLAGPGVAGWGRLIWGAGVAAYFVLRREPGAPDCAAMSIPAQVRTEQPPAAVGAIS